MHADKVRRIAEIKSHLNASAALLHWKKPINCFLIDSKVDVIYVSPVELTDDVYQYYSKLLAMRAGGDANDEPVENRYKIVVPDAVHRFPVS